ncbi:MAG: tryptophan synthase subunit alpha [Candidatus Delongbacteria bacterium]|nr:tryptophan synthase subunit alpha [Candidatus Delongbacteria bacterium]
MKGIYLVGGYPNLESFHNILKDVLKTNIDFIEIGIPFSDPVADGPVITKAIEHVVAQDIKMDDILSILIDEYEMFENNNVMPFVMTYSNIIYDYGLEKFSNKYKKFIKGLIIPDIPNNMHGYFYKKGLDIGLIPFITPESRKDDLKYLQYLKGDFIYYIGVRGITGSKSNTDYDLLSENLKTVKKFTKKNIVLGFGVKTRENVNKALEYADGFVIGTAVVKLQDNKDELLTYLTDILE